MATDSTGKTIGDYFTLQRGKTYKSALLGRPGPVLLGLGSIQRNGGFRSDSLQTYGGDSPQNLLLYPGDLYVSLKDVTQTADLLGAIARVPNSCTVGRLTQDTVKLQARTADVPLNYLYWLLRTPQYRAYCRAHATGTTNLGLSRTDFLAFPAPTPSRMQEKLVATLEALDDKIELNRRMNETLEAMARAIFKSWFVDFDAVRAKAAGRRPPGLAPHIADLFPDAFEVSELGAVPKGWHVRPIGELVRVVGGGTPSTKETAYWEGGTHAFCTPKDMSTLTSLPLLGTERYLTAAGVDRVSSRQLPSGTVLMSSRAPIGYLAIAEIPLCVNQGIIAMVCGQELPNLYVTFWAQANMDRIVANANGSTFLEISKSNFRPITALMPPTSVLAEYMRIAELLYLRLVSNLRENKQLVLARDALLPKLLSGELQVSTSAADVREAEE